MQQKLTFDIREHKKLLRVKLKQYRISMDSSEKQCKDEQIYQKLIGSKWYQNCNTVLTYVSTDIEVDTLRIINRALNDGKNVAVPKCIDGTRDMKFYYINSINDLEPGFFSVLEPIEEKCICADDFENAINIVPALSYDTDGYRLGYGKGYYDRFLSGHTELFNIGICYCGCIVSKLYRGRYDIAVDAVITEKFIKTLDVRRC